MKPDQTKNFFSLPTIVGLGKILNRSEGALGGWAVLPWLA